MHYEETEELKNSGVHLSGSVDAVPCLQDHIAFLNLANLANN